LARTLLIVIICVGGMQLLRAERAQAEKGAVSRAVTP
jgi:hypothetical protein